MNKERILALADLIEVQPKAGYFAEGGFNMGAYVHSCGTPACIAGWAVSLFDEVTDVEGHCYQIGKAVHDRAKSLLGLTYGQADTLFREYTANDPKIAARVLRELAETNEVNWPAEI